jgi:RNA polymerase sigma factor (sigma-70 family)
VLEYLYKKVFPKVKKYVCRNSGSIEDALDIFQDAIVCLCRYVRQGKFDEKHEPAAFLYSVSRNLWINKARRDSRSVNLSEAPDMPETHDFSDDIITDQKARTLQAIFKQLGDKCFQLLQYAFYQHRSNDEICELMNFATVNSVKTQKYKCRQKLLSIVEDNPSFKEIFD